MKIKSIALKHFKRFTDLSVTELSENARLVVLAGPNGCGKSSFLDALYVWHRMAWAGVGGWDASYHEKQDQAPTIQWNQAVSVAFHGEQPADNVSRRKALYVRSAYRNDPEFELDRLNKTPSALDENRFSRMIDNDATVKLNYQRLASQALEDIFETESVTTTIGQFRAKVIGEIRSSMQKVFPDLMLNSLGNPLSTGTFRFDKGSSKRFLYKNLSGGEKAAFDLICDLIIKRREYDDTVFCIDEPEAHMNTRLQGALLSELYQIMPAKSQLWVATHSIGMMRRARDLYAEKPDEVVFLDFEDLDFDKPQVLKPAVPNRAFWERALRVALDDLSELVAPNRVVICEGDPLGKGGKKTNKNVEHDAICYNAIFSAEFPETRFLSAGNSHEVESDRLALIGAIRALAKGADIVRLIDGDDHSTADITAFQTQGIRVLSRRHLEAYLFDDEVLTALCSNIGKPGEVGELIAEKNAAIQVSIGRGNPPNDIKSASGEIYVAAKRLLKLTSVGNDAKAFMRNTLAPLLTRDLTVYAELKKAIFNV